jgi:hypothetical protein
MQELFVAFLQNPTEESFRAIRDAIVNHPKYDGYSHDLREMEDAYEQKRFADVKTAFAQAQPNLLLSPGAHLLLNLAMRDEGNTQGADMERFICFRCLDGIQLTGDGTKERPFLVLRTSDEYDLLSTLGKQLSQQGLIHENDRSYDVMTCADGSELWFDITDMFAAMARRMNAGGN